MAIGYEPGLIYDTRDETKYFLTNETDEYKKQELDEWLKEQNNNTGK